DGINVAQRIMSFARPGQIVVSRSYYDVVSNLASEYAKLFTYEGSRTDKHVREHEIYVVGHHEGALQKAKDGMKDRASSTTPNPRKPRNGSGAGTSTVTLTIPSFVHDKKKLTMVAGSLAALVILLGVLVATKKPSTPPLETVTAPASTTEPTRTASTSVPPPAAGEAGKPAEPPKPEPRLDTKVLEPAPSASQVPPAAPAPAPAEKPKETPRTEPVRSAEPRPAAEPAKPALPPATVVFAVQPWGEIYVNGKARGVTPPTKSLKLEPGKYKVEVRNTTFAPHVENLDLKARDEVTVRHKFQ